MSHYFDEKPDSKYIEHTLNTKIKRDGKEVSLTLTTASGLFSLKRLDVATKLLIEKSEINPESKILDLGCGYGVVAIALKKLYPSIDITASDINERAIQITNTNAKGLGINVQKSNICKNLPHDFDSILTNPPYVAGRKVCFAFIEESFECLKIGGNLQLVARHNKGGKTLSEKMESIFGNVKSLAINSGFRIYYSVKE